MTILKAILLLSSVSSPFAFAHGKISLLECYNGKHEIQVRAEASGNSDEVRLITFESNRQNQVLKPVTVKIEDTVKKDKVVEKIILTSGKSVLNLDIPEIYAHKIRQGSGTWHEKGAKPQKMNMCYLVYRQE